MYAAVWIRSLGTVAVLALAATACAGEPEDVEVVEQEPVAVEQTAPSTAPDTTAAGVWAHLQAEDYRENWRLWPGKGELYSGVEPHGMLLTTYVNALAYDALTNGAGAMPEGAMVVKENFMPDSTFAAATVMYKVTGYNAEHQDWYFAKYDPAGVVDVAGRAPMCQACHSSAPGSDYLFTELPR